MNDVRSEYIARLNRVLDYIHTHLDQPLPLETLAGVAGFSPYHFHRLFKSLVGETLSNYVQRARLEKAANLLLYEPGQSILAVGLDCGFSGAAVFTRAFKDHFGQSPSEYRKNRKPERKQRKAWAGAVGYNGRTLADDLLTRSDVQMNIEVKTLPSYHVAYIRHITGYSKGEYNREIGQAFQRVCGWAAARDLFNAGTLTIGIPYDNPDITPNDRCRYDACVTVPAEVTEGSGEVGVQDIPGGKYAVCRISVSAAETDKIGEAADHLYGEWLPSSGYTVDDKPALEIYYEDAAHPAGAWVTMDFCVPLRPM